MYSLIKLIEADEFKSLKSSMNVLLKLIFIAKTAFFDVAKFSFICVVVVAILFVLEIFIAVEVLI